MTKHIWHVGNWCIHTGNQDIESPFLSTKKNVEVLNYGQPFLDALRGIEGAEVFSQLSSEPIYYSKFAELVRMMKAFVLWLLFAGISFGQSIDVVPNPAKTSVLDRDNKLTLPRVLSVSNAMDASWKKHLEIVAVLVDRMSRGVHQIQFQDSPSATLKIVRMPALSSEEYQLTVAASGITLHASTLKGLAHATATLMQIIGNSDGSLPLMTVKDEPKRPYRNFMIDMGRNPHSFELLKETVDLLWFYKIDSVQLHLTDDQRFAFPSTAFPKLWDGKISLDEFHELEAYAVVRGVTIIPELEVPGHSGILRNKYPEVFGENPADLAKDEKALVGIKTLLDEMMEVFSSTPYIHIGGDEAFGVPEDSQRDLINHLHEYLKSKGRQTLVWEGPRPGKGENKVHDEVIHLNWRTINYPADQMLRDGHRVVNATWDPLYIVDHFPRINFTMTSPQHIYETMKLTRFKHVNPGIPTFAEPVEVAPSKQLIGFCMPWWEGREENYFAQNVPRLIPFSDVAWNPNTVRNYEEFKSRVRKSEALRRAAFYPVEVEASELAVPEDGVFHRETILTMRSSGSSPGTEIRYTLDGTHPTASSPLFTNAITLTNSSVVRAGLFRDGEPIGHATRRNLTCVEPVTNLALGKPVSSSVSSGSPFSVGRVNDGGTDNLGFYLAYPAEPEPVSITIDLEEVQNIGRVVVHAYTISNSFEKYTVEVSVDGRTFEQVAARLDKPEEVEGSVEHRFESRPVRFVRIKSHGNKGYVFDSFSKIVEVQVFAE